MFLSKLIAVASIDLIVFQRYLLTVLVGVHIGAPYVKILRYYLLWRVYCRLAQQVLESSLTIVKIGPAERMLLIIIIHHIMLLHDIVAEVSIYPSQYLS